MSKGYIKTVDKDRGYSKIVKEIGKAKGSYVTIGVHEGAGEYELTGVGIAQVAFWNEYGTSRAPSRPFIRSTIDTKGNEFRAASKRLFQDVLALKKTVEVALGALGTRIAIEIQGRIEDSISWAKPNAPSTTEMKSFGRGWTTRPLILSGTMLRAIGWQTSVGRIKSDVTVNPSGA